VSESNKRHCAGAVQSHWVGIWCQTQMCLETGPEDSPVIVGISWRARYNRTVS